MVITIDPKPVKSIDEAYIDAILEIHEACHNSILTFVLTESTDPQVLTESFIEKVKAAAKAVKNAITKFFEKVKARFVRFKEKVKNVVGAPARCVQAIKDVQSTYDEVLSAFEKSIDRFDDNTDVDQYTEDLLATTQKAIETIQARGDNSIDAIRASAKKAGNQIIDFLESNKKKYNYDDVKNMSPEEFDAMMADKDSILVFD